MVNSKEFISIVDDSSLPKETEKQDEANSFSWQILIVDDENIIHDATKLALMHENILGWPITLHHAYSAEEGMQKILSGIKFVVAFIDIVMETTDAGLNLIRQIRNKGYTELRLIVRTGQPGYAPELSVLNDYDINDYRTKTELTKSKLLSVLISAIRSYQQIETINNARRGLELIINASSDLLKQQNIVKFGEGVLTQITSLLGVQTSGIVSIMDDTEKDLNDRSAYKIICTSGKFHKHPVTILSEIDDKKMEIQFGKALKEHIVSTENGSISMHISLLRGSNAFIYIDCGFKLSDDNIALLKLFGMNIFASFNNISLIEKLDEKAYKDDATGFPNMNAVKNDISVALNDDKSPVLLLLIHLDGLGKIFTLFGSETLSQISGEVYRMLSKRIPEARIIARSAFGDLAVLIDEKNFERSIIQSLRVLPVDINQSEFNLTTTISLASSLPGETEPDNIIQRATLALILGKSGNRDPFTEYDDVIASKLKERIALQYLLRESFRSKTSSIQVFLQPKFDTFRNEIVGAEALSRLQMNEAYISPDIFIPVIEESGLSIMLTDVLLNALRSWNDNRRNSNLKSIPVSINLTMKDLQHKNYSRYLLDKLMELNLTPDLIEFEITEGIIMYSREQVIEELKELKSAGFKIACDDFGTGYSSLSYLDSLPVDILKIDKAFVTPLTPQTARRSIAATIIAMAESLELEVVAEGIETETQFQALQFLGCNICQGYLFGKPVNINEFDKTFPA